MSSADCFGWGRECEGIWKMRLVLPKQRLSSAFTSKITFKTLIWNISCQYKTIKIMLLFWSHDIYSLCTYFQAIVAHFLVLPLSFILSDVGYSLIPQVTNLIIQTSTYLHTFDWWKIRKTQFLDNRSYSKRWIKYVRIVDYYSLVFLFLFLFLTSPPVSPCKFRLLIISVNSVIQGCIQTGHFWFPSRVCFPQ